MRDLVTRSEVVANLEDLLQTLQTGVPQMRDASARHDAVVTIEFLNSIIEKLTSMPPVPQESSLKALGIPAMKMTFEFECREKREELSENPWQHPSEGKPVTHDMVFTISDADVHHFIQAITSHQMEYANHQLVTVSLTSFERP